MRKIKIYADGADVNTMKEAAKSGKVDGFTTNPSLMKKAGVTDYKAFAKQVVENITDVSVSFEVFGDDMETMEKEAKIISELGKNVFVKIPIVNTQGESMIPLIKKLSAAGINVNVTAIYNIEQVKAVVDCVTLGQAYASIFVGRLTDNGHKYFEFVEESVKLCQTNPKVELLWASTREVLNIAQAEEMGVDIITVPQAMIDKYFAPQKSTEELSIDTVKGFAKDISSLGFSILD